MGGRLGSAPERVAGALGARKERETNPAARSGTKILGPEYLMTMRKILFWMHLTAGCLAGLVILVMCVTGAMLAYGKQIVTWSERSFYRTPPAAGVAQAPVEELLGRVRAFDGSAAPTSVTWRADRGAPVEIAFGRERRLLVNPYTGEILGEGAKRLRGFFVAVENCHRWLAVPAERRATGRAITAACNLAFLFLLGSGICMWWPRNWSWLALRNVVLFNRQLRGRARDFNWHNVIGFWGSVPLFVVVACSVVMSYPWANAAVYKATGSPVPVQAAAGGPGQSAAQGAGPRAARAVSYDGLGVLFARASEKVSGWQTIALRLPGPADATATFSIDTGNGGRPDRRAQLTLDRKTGGEISWEPFSSFNSGRRLRTWIRFTHTGEAGGWLGETIAATAALAGVFLVCTGMAMALRRLYAWRGPREKVAAGQDSPEEVTV